MSFISKHYACTSPALKFVDTLILPVVLHMLDVCKRCSNLFCTIEFSLCNERSIEVKGLEMIAGGEIQKNWRFLNAQGPRFKTKANNEERRTSDSTQL